MRAILENVRASNAHLATAQRHTRAAADKRREAQLALLERHHMACHGDYSEREELEAEAREAEAEAERLEALAARALARFEACQRRLG